MNDDMITKTDLKSRRNWTDSLIKKYLPTPDKEYPNPRSKSAGDIKLYRLEKVKVIEESDAFKADKGKAQKRQASAKAAVMTKKQMLILEMQKYQPEIKIIPTHELERLANEHYNERKMFSRPHRRDPYSARETNAQFTQRITLNYLRHQLTDYEEKLQNIASKIGVKEAYGIIREKIDAAILDAYPHLK